MRELKYRVYIPEFSKYVYFGLNDFDYSDRYLTNDEYPIQQYTGCHDSSNKEIYEGDIVQYNNGDVIRIGYIEFMSGIFFLNYNDETDEELGYLLVSNLKVIGNKFEHKELI